MARQSSAKIRQEFWDTAKGFIGWCDAEELRVLRIMAATELEKRLKAWDEILESDSKEKLLRKAKAIAKNVKKSKLKKCKDSIR